MKMGSGSGSKYKYLLKYHFLFTEASINRGNPFHRRWDQEADCGAPMGSPLSPVMAEIFMEHLEDIAFKDGFTAFGVKMFKRYVDDIFVIIETGKEIALLDHLNGLFTGQISVIEAKVL
uniref:Reverse transcriptase domain-containing protein n=1 Tax=Trichuris muris TaxID=70415 RepID=A0A5S6Q3I9_TRIMR